MENLVLVRPDPAFWEGRRVVVTGHTGFKGAWLSLMLNHLGATVVGLSDDAAEHHIVHHLTAPRPGLDSVFADVVSDDAVTSLVLDAKPSVIFHLAAQALVAEAHSDPRRTVETNVLGTMSVLDAIRKGKGIDAAVIVTSDKVFDHGQSGGRPFDEESALGGNELYAASKASAELLVRAFRSAYPPSAIGGTTGIATARAGNVIGGGDWAPHRLVPDFFRAAREGRAMTVWNPSSVRPWQHVLDVCSGYVVLAQRLAEDPFTYSRGWNFANRSMECTVLALLQHFSAMLAEMGHAPPDMLFASRPRGFHEDTVLRLDCSRTTQMTGWNPKMSLDESIHQTAAWNLVYIRSGADTSLREQTFANVQEHLDDSRAR